MNERLCNLDKWRTGFSLTNNSLFLTQYPTSSKSSSRICVRVLGTVEKVCFVCMIPPTEHLIVLVHDVFERGIVHVLVNHYRYHVWEGDWVKINFWKLKQPSSGARVGSWSQWLPRCFHLPCLRPHQQMRGKQLKEPVVCPWSLSPVLWWGISYVPVL